MVNDARSICFTDGLLVSDFSPAHLGCESLSALPRGLGAIWRSSGVMSRTIAVVCLFLRKLLILCLDNETCSCSERRAPIPISAPGDKLGAYSHPGGRL